MSSQMKFVNNQDAVVIWLAHGSTLSKIKNFAYAIQSYTNAEIRRVWATQGDGVNIPEKAGEIQSVYLYAHIFIRRVSDQKLFAIKLPAPVYDTVFDEDQTVKPAVGEAIATAYSILAGEAFEFYQGALAGEVSFV